MALIPPVVIAPGVTRYNNPRRYAFRTAWYAHQLDDPGQESAWHAKQLRYSGTPIPTNVPYQAELARAWYRALEDFGTNTPIPVTLQELQIQAHLTASQAREVLAALGVNPS